MFWHRPAIKILFVFQSIAFWGCTANNNNTVTSFADTSKINRWETSYNSLYDNFDKTKKTIFLEQAGVFADSLLAEDQLLNDSNRRKKYIDLAYYRATDLDILESYFKSRELFERYFLLSAQYGMPNPEYYAFSQLTLGNIYSRYGDYNKALLLLGQSLKYYTAAKKTEETASCLLNTAIPQKELLRYNESEQTLLRIFRIEGLGPKRKGKACIALADIYTRQKKIAEAGFELKKAKDFISNVQFKSGEHERPEIYSAIFKIEGDWLAAAGKPLEALSVYKLSLDSAKVAYAQNPRNREVGKLYIAMGKALEKLSFPDSALGYYSRALYTVTDIDTADKFSLLQQKDIYAENTIAEALYARADCIIERGIYNEAELQNVVDCYKLAFETEKKLLNSFSYDESRLHMLQETRKQTEKAIAVCYRLYERTKDQRWANEAFLFAEHNKAFVLAESVRRNTASSLFLEKDTLYKKIQSLRNTLAVTEIELNQKRFSVSPDTASIKALSLGKQKAEEELLSAENNIRIKNPQYNDWMTNEVSLPAEEIINKTILPGTAFIEYFTGDSAVYAFTGAKGQPLAFHKLPANTKKITGDLLHFFSDQNLILNDPVKYAVAANTLYNSILGPYLPQKGSSLLIIPDGFIGYIPFDALLTGPAVSTNISSFPFLIKQQETYYAFSCKTLLAQAQNKNSSTGNSIAAFAPVFTGWERGISPLLHSSEELEAIKQRYPGGKFYTGNEATLKQFEENAVNTGIMHLATHASSGNDSAVAGVEFYDSALYLNRIYTLPLKARLVVLSGCETGSGAINKTEGLMSLARAFSYAGTRNVIGSLWQTEDNTSSEIFKNFYSNLSGNDFSTALYKAKLSVINNSTVASASPYYWSGYIYIGSPGENINQRSSAKLKLIGVLAVLAIITAYFFFRIKRRKT